MNSGLIFAILLTLLSHKKVTAKYLAEKYEMSERTVARYVDALGIAGVPIFATPGRGGGYELASEYQFDKTFFTEGELSRIIGLLKKEKGKEKDEDKLNAIIIDKLEYLEKRKEGERYLIGNDSLIIDGGSWNNPASYRAKMEALQKAIDKKTSVKLVYVDRYETRTHRRFDPYYRVLKDGVWYTFGWCHTRQDFRLFKLARITSIMETDLPFERREHNVYEHLDAGFENADWVDIEFEFSSTILADIEEWLGHDAIFERGYKYIAHATVPGGKALLAKLLGFGSSITLLSPQSLCEEIKKECERVLKKF